MQRVLEARRKSARGSGYVVDSLWSAAHCLRETGDVENCLRRAVALGNDTDTTAVVVAGLAGVRYGLRALPPCLVGALRGREIAEALLAALPNVA